MKKVFYLVFILLLAGQGVVKGQAALLVLIFGEKVASENFYFSLKVGANYSMVNGVEEGSNRWGPNFGLVNNIKLSERFFLTPEFLALSPRGVTDVPILTTGNPELDALLGNVPSSTDRKLNYIDVPVLLKMKLGERWSLSAGPQFSYLTGAVDIYESSPINGTILTTEIDIKDIVSRYDVAAAVNITFKVSETIAGKGMNLYIRYTQGFIDISTDNEIRHTNSTFQFGASFPFIEKQDGDN
ncbi:MAG: porin family protein [Bacteroidota bacterium]